MFSPVRRRGLSSPGNPTFLAIVGALALVVSTAAPLAAQTAPEPMFACYVPLTGTVYRIKSPGTPTECTKPKGNSPNHADHVQFAFNAQGTQGPAGPQGPQGEVGPMGPAGAVGAAGPQGAAGAVGATGATGAVGPQGAKGDAGPAGPQGVGGPMGPAGQQGQTGPQGMMGPQGPQGNPGVSGYQLLELRVGVGASSTAIRSLDCPAGKVPFSGGFAALDGASNFSTVTKSAPTATGWTLTLKNPNSSFSNNFQIYVICGSVL